MPESRPISSSRVSTGDIARHTFAIVRRGYDTDEVHTYLAQVARSIEALEEHEDELRRAMAEADERAAHPVLDESTLTASLGQHSAQILRNAHEEAARIVAEAQDSAAASVRDAQSRANELIARAEGDAAERVAEAELMVGSTAQDARDEADRIRETAIAEGDAIIARAKEEGRGLLDQVKEARARVLGELTGRRRALSIQIDQLRAARDELAATVHGTRDSIDGILTQLHRADDEARAAALAAGDQARLHGPSDAGDEEVDPGGVAAEVDVAADEYAPEGQPTASMAPPDVTAAVPATSSMSATSATSATSNSPAVEELFARIRAGAGEEGHQDAAGATTVMPAVEPAVTPEQALVTRRDDLLLPVTARLARNVKRALGDDQNRLLETLRVHPAASSDVLLGPEDLHLSSFVSASEGFMAEAFAAGVAFAGASEGSVTPTSAVEQSAAGLARTVVAMLRRRIEEGEGSGAEMAERVGAAFREWRGERIERLAGDFAVQAFSAGVAAGSVGGSLQWVVTSEGGCSDCDDNALAGAVSMDEGFPTGHPYPPAHSGCRCLITPAPGP